MSDVMVRVMAWKYGNVLDTLMSQFATKELPEDGEYSWDLIGPSERNYALVEARKEDGTVIDLSTSGNIGANQCPFYLVFEEDWTWRGATIVGNLNELYQMVVIDEPRFEGSRTIYRVYLSGSNVDGIPSERLLPGEKFSFEANYISDDFSREVGDLSFASHAKMKNWFSTIRTKYKVGGKMCADKLAIGIPILQEDNRTVKVVEHWMLYVDFEFERQFRNQKNRALAYGVSNRNANGEWMDYDVNGRAIKKSAGLYQQLELGNTMYVNKFSLKVLEQALRDLFQGTTDYNDRHVVITTGDAGAMDFHKAVMSETQGWTPFQGFDNTGVVYKTNSPYHTNSLGAGFQYTQFKSPMGIIVDILVDQSYNDPVRNKITMPDGSLAYSHRMDIMDLGPKENRNIFKVTSKANPEVRGYQAGPFGNPFLGTMGNNNASYDEDSAVAHKKATVGMCVLDPTRTMSIIPNVLRG